MSYDISSSNHSFNITISEDGIFSTQDQKDNSDDSIWTPEVVIRVATVLSVMVVTFLGNIFLIIMLICKQSRRIKRVNIFIINLAIGDLAVACITMTTEIIFVAFGEWVLGPFICKLTVYLQAVTLSSATFLLVGMSIDRYQVIVRPMESLASRPKIWTKVITAWLLAMLFSVPQLFIFLQDIVIKDDKPKIMCISNGYTAAWQRKVYSTFFALYILLIPASIMLFCYYNIAKVVWKRLDSHRGKEVNDTLKVTSARVSVRRNLVSASKQRVVKMTLLVIIGFLVCLTPYIALSMIRIYSDYKIKLSGALSVSELIFMIHSAVNPILYGIFTLRIKHIKAVFSCVNRRRGLREDIIKQRMRDQSKCLELKCKISLSRKRPSYKDTSVIIANHAAKEESELIVRNVRKSNTIKRTVIGRTLSDNFRKSKVEKSTQVDDYVLLNTMVCNGYEEDSHGNVTFL